MRVAIIHDWLVTYAGAERVLEQIIQLYPEAELFSLVDFLDEKNRSFILNKQVKTSFIQKLPFAKSKYRVYLPLMPIAIEQFDLSDFDLVISSSHAVAKGVITGPDQLHICMCYSPIRYAWDLQHQYLKESNLNTGIKSWLARWVLHKIRIWDIRTSNGVDEFVAISEFISKRIKKAYRRNSEIIYPPVYVNDFINEDVDLSKEEFYMTSSRMVPYKKIDLIVDAFTKLLPDKQLVVIGDGPEMKKIKNKAGSNVKVLGYQTFDSLKSYLKNSKAFIFAAEEDFGIAPLEAQASGTPVIAFGKGGALETIIGLDKENPTGVFFYKQTIESLVEAVKSFEREIEKITGVNCINNAMRFSDEEFRFKFKKFVKNKYLEWKN